MQDYSRGNSAQKAVILEFKALKDFGYNYKNYDTIGLIKNNTLYICVDKNADAPKEALAAIIAAKSVHIDEKNSINEEIYA